MFGWLTMLAVRRVQPLGMFLGIAVLGFYGAVAAFIIWRRTGFPWLTVSLGCLSLASAILIGLWLMDYRIQTAPLVGIVASILLFVAGGLGISGDHAKQERELLRSDGSSSETAVDRLLFRNVPHLRH